MSDFDRHECFVQLPTKLPLNHDMVNVNLPKECRYHESLTEDESGFKLRFNALRRFFYFNEVLYHQVRGMQGITLLKISLGRLSTTCFKKVHAGLTLVRCVMLETHNDVVTDRLIISRSSVKVMDHKK